MVAPTPLTKTFIKAAIASGALTPPPGGYHTPADRLLRLAGWILALLGIVALAVAYWVQRP